MARCDFVGCTLQGGSLAIASFCNRITSSFCMAGGKRRWWPASERLVWTATDRFESLGQFEKWKDRAREISLLRYTHELLAVAYCNLQLVSYHESFKIRWNWPTARDDLLPERKFGDESKKNWRNLFGTKTLVKEPNGLHPTLPG